jgi:hypothetical protein
MYAERVSIRRGPSPILLVAPHAAPGDDVNTDIITEHLGDLLDCNFVINRGWNRGDNYDYDAETADCNNVLHMIDVVKDEFLLPLLNLKTQILRKSPICHVFFIHGMATKPNVDVVIGYGAGSPNSFSCSPWRKNLLYTLLENESMDTWVGKAGGNYSGWARNNMNQYFRKHSYESSVHSMQLEFSRAIRESRGVSELTAEYLANALGDYINYDKFEKVMSPAEL